MRDKMEYPEDIVEEPLLSMPPPVSGETDAAFRPAGKLFGRSLIDDLEDRKQAMRNKQRCEFQCSSFIPIMVDSIQTGYSMGTKDLV